MTASFIMPTHELYLSVEKAYPDKFFEGIFQGLGVKDDLEKKTFQKTATFVGAQYLALIQNNPDRFVPSTQKSNLNDYKNALSAAKVAYEKIASDNPTCVKFHETLLAEYDQQSLVVQEMLSPYVTKGSYTVSNFFDLLTFLIDACEKAKSRDIGFDNSVVSKNALAWWIAMIGHSWPPSTTAEFRRGAYSKDAGTYKTPAFNALVKLIKKIDSITEKDVAAAMEKAVVLGRVQNPTELLYR